MGPTWNNIFQALAQLWTLNNDIGFFVSRSTFTESCCNQSKINTYTLIQAYLQIRKNPFHVFRSHAYNYLLFQTLLVWSMNQTPFILVLIQGTRATLFTLSPGGQLRKQKKLILLPRPIEGGGTCWDDDKASDWRSIYCVPFCRNQPRGKCLHETPP